MPNIETRSWPRRSGHPRATDGNPSRRRSPIPRVAERAARGKAARAMVPRSGQGDWEPASDRRDPVELLEEQAASRVPELVPIRYGRMLVSPFTFFRGAAYPMAADLADAPRTGLRRAALWRCTPVQLRCLRRARSAAGIQHQRLRRDAAGPVRVGRKAAGGQLRRGRPGSRLRRETARSRSTALWRGRTARRSAGFAGMSQPRPVVLPHRRGRDRRAGRLERPARKGAQALRAQRGQGAVEGQPERIRASSPRSSTASRGSRATRR